MSVLRSHRLQAVSATAAIIVALPLLASTPASAAPATRAAAPTGSCTTNPYLPWAVHGAKAVTIRSKPKAGSTALGILYKSHKFKVHSHTKRWVNITDKNTKVRGYVSATYVYRDVRMCLS
ncbi:SH3 domain-containing protein [Streptomyces anulatus]|uniref:SH3 domain-containing protein n=1 Tax=Streptomyces anulatus TaxID=1892 RepID=UPI001C27CBEF|nr:SH3 domain-containing protein [Streptomyces anulatus]